MKYQELYEKTSKKDYNAIANILNGCGDKKECIARRLAEYFKKDNPAFDEARFLAASGIKE